MSIIESPERQRVVAAFGWTSWNEEGWANTWAVCHTSRKMRVLAWRAGHRMGKPRHCALLAQIAALS